MLTVAATGLRLESLSGSKGRFPVRLEVDDYCNLDSLTSKLPRFVLGVRLVKLYGVHGKFFSEEVGGGLSVSEMPMRKRCKLYNHQQSNPQCKRKDPLFVKVKTIVSLVLKQERTGVESC